MQNFFHFSTGQPQKAYSPISHGTCPKITILELLKMLLQTPQKIKDSQESQILTEAASKLQSTQDMIKYPCCSEYVSKSKLKSIVSDFCLKCGSRSKSSDASQKIFLIEKCYSLCNSCFQSYKEFGQDQFQQGSVEYYLSKIIWRCNFCASVIGYESDMGRVYKTATNQEIMCKRCNEQEQISKQSQINQRSQMLSSQISSRSFLSFLTDQQRNVLLKSRARQLPQKTLSNKSVSHSNESANRQNESASLLIHKFDVSTYSTKSKPELLQIIQQLKQLNQRQAQYIKLLKEKTKSLQLRQNESRNSDSKNSYLSPPIGTAQYQGGLKESRNSKFSNTHQGLRSPSQLNVSVFSKTNPHPRVCESSGSQVSCQSKMNINAANVQLLQGTLQNSELGTQKPPTVVYDRKEFESEPDSRCADFQNSNKCCETEAGNISNLNKMIQSLTHTNTKGETESNDSGESGSNIYQVKAGIRQTAPVYSAVLEQDEIPNNIQSYQKKNSYQK